MHIHYNPDIKSFQLLYKYIYIYIYIYIGRKRERIVEKI